MAFVYACCWTTPPATAGLPHRRPRRPSQRPDPRLQPAAPGPQQRITQPWAACCTCRCSIGACTTTHAGRRQRPSLAGATWGRVLRGRPAMNFTDIDLLGAGPVAEQLARSFDEYWNNQLSVPIQRFLWWQPKASGSDRSPPATARLPAAGAAGQQRAVPAVDAVQTGAAAAAMAR